MKCEVLVINLSAHSTKSILKIFLVTFFSVNFITRTGACMVLKLLEYLLYAWFVHFLWEWVQDL